MGRWTRIRLVVTVPITMRIDICFYHLAREFPTPTKSPQPASELQLLQQRI